MYIRFDYGLKIQSGNGSIGTLYFNKGENTWKPTDINYNILPPGFLDGNIGVNINPSILSQQNFNKTFKSLMPTYAWSIDLTKTIDKKFDTNLQVNAGVQIYSCWNGNRDAKKGFWESGAEFGFNVGGGKLAGTPATFYFFIDVIIGFKDTIIEKILDETDEKLNSSLDSIMDRISKTMSGLMDSNTEFDEAEDSEEGDVVFEDGTPEIVEAVDGIEAAETTVETVAAWETFLEVLEITGPFLLLA